MKAMRNLALLLLPTVILQVSHAEESSSKTKNAVQATVEQTIQLILKKGRDWTVFENSQLAAPFGFPDEGAPSKALAESGTPVRLCSVVIKPGETEDKPVCMVIETTQDFASNRKTKHWTYRFDLDGHLEKAYSFIGENDEAGQPVKSSAVTTAHDIEDPDIRSKAQAELSFWLKRAHELMKKDSTARKPSGKAEKKADAIIKELR